MNKVNVKSFFERNGSWIFAAVGCVVLWVLMGVAGNGLSFQSLINNAYTAAFLGIAGLAQMLVVSTGRGAIDLSIPGMITLGAYLGMGIMNGKNSMIIPAFLVIIAVGCVVGILNSMMVAYLKIPAIIATMAMNYIIVTGTMLIDHSFNVFTIPSIMSTIVKFRIAGIPVIIFFVIALTFLINYLLTSTTYGKSLLSLGQNLEAARLAGVRVVKVQMITYVISSVFSGISGALLSARNTGAYLGMGDNYQMDSIACIVIGGTLMSGGRANAAGTLVGSLFLYMVISAMQLLGANAGMQNAVKGALIVIVLLIGASDKKLSREVKYKKNAPAK